MKEYTITRKDIDANGNYIGKTDLSDFDGTIRSEGGLGTIKFSGYLIAKGGIYFEAGDGIEAGWGIEAGLGIEAGCGIQAGCGITCKTLSSKLRIFAGLCLWRKPTDKELEIRCEELLSGEICFGNLIIEEKPVEELTMEQVCAELGREIKIKKG